MLSTKNKFTNNKHRINHHNNKIHTIAAISTNIVAIKQQLLLLSNNFIIFLFVLPIRCALSSKPYSKFYIFILIYYIRLITHLATLATCLYPCCHLLYFWLCLSSRQVRLIDLVIVDSSILPIVLLSLR